MKALGAFLFCVVIIASLIVAGCVGLASPKSQAASAGAFSPSSLSFSAQPVHTKSNTQTVTLTNAGNAAMSISGISASGDFSQTNNCPTIVVMGAICSVNVTFTPSTSGPRAGMLSLSDSSSSAAHTVALTGTGLNVSSTISAAPLSVDFGSVPSGNASAGQSITVTNSGGSNLSVTGFATTASFSVSAAPSVPMTLLPGEKAYVTVAFVPAASTATSAVTGSLTVSSDSSNGPAIVALSGTAAAVSTAPGIGVQPASLDFGNEIVASATPAQTVKNVAIQNTGNADLVVSAITSNATQFTIVAGPAIPLTISAGQSANISVAFVPGAIGAFSGTLTITSDAAGSPSLVALSGNGVAGGSALSVTPGSLGFGSLNLGSTSAPQTITVKNNGSQNVTVSAIAASPGQFVAVAAAATPFTLATGQSAAVNVTFAPIAAGALSGTLTISSDASPSPDAVSLSGTGVRPGDGGGTDIYGGSTALACSDGPKPHFYTQKINNRWWLCTPAGNAFWLRSIYHVDGNDFGTDYQGISVGAVIQQKYGNNSTTWGPVTIKRMQSWGFNATAEYSSAYVQPTTTHSDWTTPDHTNPEKMPFIALLWPGHYSRNPNPYAAPVKDLLGATDSNYKGFRHPCLDVFDPNFGLWLQKVLQDPTSSEYKWIHSAHSDYLIGFNVDDPDELFGFGAGPDFKGFTSGQPDDYTHAHLGLVALVTAPTQASGTDGSGRPISYTDTKVYTKQAFSDWLAARYSGDINSLDQAWGANYSTFGSDGGWPNGSGLLDEDGRHSWVPQDSSRLTGINATMKKDLDDFLVAFAQKYFSTIKGVLQTEAPGILYFGPTNVGGWGAPARKEILQGAAPYLDAIMLSTIPTLCISCTDDQQRIDFVAQYGGDKPWMNWEAISAPPDSYMSVFPITHVSAPYGTTQGLRGQLFQTMVSGMLSAKDSAGTYHFVGYKWWQYYDSRGEQGNWGLVTPRDNPYDGVSAVIATGRDAFGYPTGGERANYGDFIGAVTNANTNVYKSILGLP